MRKYVLNKKYNVLIQLPFALSPLIFMAFIAVVFTWDHLYYGKLGLAFILLMIGIFLFGKYLSSIKYEIYIDDNILHICNSKTNKIRNIIIDEICLVQYDKIIRNSFSKNLTNRDTINIHSNKDKIIFVCTNEKYPADFYSLLEELCSMIRPIEKSIYNYKDKGATFVRIAYINPSYEGSRIVKRIVRKIGRSYPIVIFSIVLILFVILYAVWQHYFK